MHVAGDKLGSVAGDKLGSVAGDQLGSVWLVMKYTFQLKDAQQLGLFTFYLHLTTNFVTRHPSSHLWLEITVLLCC